MAMFHTTQPAVHNVQQNFTVSRRMESWEIFYSPLYLTFLNISHFSTHSTESCRKLCMLSTCMG